MEIINDTLFDDLLNKMNENESIIEFMNEKGLDTTNHRNSFYKCIFHDDKTPSLSINEKKGMFHCFSCGRGGKYFDFIYNYEKVVLKRKSSRKKFMEELITRDRRIRVKYGVKSLQQRITFSPETLEYMLQVKNATKKYRKQQISKVLSDKIDNERPKFLVVEEELKKLKSDSDIVEFLSKIQHGIIDI